MRTRRAPALALAVITACLLGVALLPSTPARAAAPLFADDFESGTLGAWTSSSGVTVQQQLVHEGNWAARAHPTASKKAFADATLTGPATEVYVRTWFEIVSRSTSLTLLRVLTATGSKVASVSVSKGGKLSLTDAVSKVTKASPTHIADGVWLSVELHILISGGSSRVDVWLDGAPIGALSRLDPFGTTPVGRIGIGDTAGGKVYNAAFDDVVADRSYVDMGPPSTPVGLQATAPTPDEIDLSWQPSWDDVGVTGYAVYRSDGEGFSHLGDVSGTSYADIGLTPSSTWSYEVAARDAAGNLSPLSTAVTATTPQTVDDSAPSTPTDLTATAPTSARVELQWTGSTDNVGVAGYDILRSDGGPFASVGTTSDTSFSDMGLAPASAYLYEVDAFDIAENHSSPTTPVSVTTPAAESSPISHVVVIDLENHSFDSLLGRLCAQIADGTITDHAPCDGATTATLSTGAVVPIATSPDLVPGVEHDVSGQVTAVDGGRMDGFDLLSGCGESDSYACITQYDPSQEPNLASLAERFVISDRTFEFHNTPSWSGHIALVAATTDGFNGDNPTPSTFTSKKGPGWGCDSYKDAPWWNGSAFEMVPSCIPDSTGAGPYRASPVPYVPTIFDRLDAAQLTWRIYGGLGEAGTGAGSGYWWAICPTFFECLGSPQHNNLLPAADVITDAQAGSLPTLSIVTPTSADSEHNGYSMAVGDDWLGQVVGAIQNGPDWPSTAIFITWDDFGGFYDHVPPAFAGQGIRIPLVIVSPYARLGTTDSTDATFASILAYIEDNFGLAPLSTGDATAYDYSGAFDYSQTPATAPVHMVRTKVPAAELRWIAAHPDRADDPT